MSEDRERQVNLDAGDVPQEPYQLPAGRTFAKAFGLKTSDLVTARMQEIIDLLWLPEGSSNASINAKIKRAIELYESLAPADGAEGMLAAQMVGTHFAALECLRRAAVPGQTFEGRDMALKHAQKLMALYTQQLAALNKHRGKGQQKVTVEHVHVAAGGQAIVGNVQTSAPKHDTPAALEHGREIPMEPLPAREPTKPRRKDRP